jgi:hypothetical protein
MDRPLRTGSNRQMINPGNKSITGASEAALFQLQ